MSLIYEAINTDVLLSMPKTARRLLDVGCGTGSFGCALKQSQRCEVYGITFSEEEAELAKSKLDAVVIADLNAFDPAGLGRFDVVICSRVLEHLFNPMRLLVGLRNSYSQYGHLIVVLPNILFWKQLLLFLSGKFRYTDGGSTDRTHFRFFDWVSAQALVRDSGYQIERVVVNGHFPLPLVRRFLPHQLCNKIDRVSGRLSPGLFAPQFVLIARPTGGSLV